MIRLPTPQRNQSWWLWAEAMARAVQSSLQKIEDALNGLGFTSLSDTPKSYVGQTGKVLAVNAGETGLEFVAAGGGSAPTKGTAIIDFGVFPGTTDTSVAVIGQASILAGSSVKVWITPVLTADHSVDEHLIAATQIAVLAGNIIAGTGFTVYAMARDIGSEPLDLPGIGRFANASGTTGQNSGTSLGASVGGTDLSRQYGQFTVAWEWV